MLKVSNLTKSYRGGVRALDGLDLRIGSGMFGLLGPNGAGKSSLIRTLAGLQRPDHGEILFDGIDTLAQPQELRRRLGYLPQYFGAYPFIGCRALLWHMAILKGLPDNRETQSQIDALLETTNLSEHASRAVSNFSGGMRQRFGIAQALLGSPDLLILDEPTAGLDPEERLRFYNLLSKLSENRVVLLSTHIVDDVEQLCPNLAIIIAGRIREQGQTEALIKKLEGQIWEGQGGATSDAVLLNTAYRRGLPVSRYRSAVSPGHGFVQVAPTLQDVYFHELKNAGVQ